MIIYGMVKVIPVQMHYPALTRLLQTFGTLSPMGFLGLHGLGPGL